MGPTFGRNPCWIHSQEFANQAFEPFRVLVKVNYYLSFGYFKLGYTLVIYFRPNWNNLYASFYAYYQ